MREAKNLEMLQRLGISSLVNASPDVVHVPGAQKQQHRLKKHRLNGSGVGSSAIAVQWSMNCRCWNTWAPAITFIHLSQHVLCHAKPGNRAIF